MLTRDVAYGSLTKRERAHLHAAFAGWFERSRGGRDEDAPLLAHHYAEAVRPEDADLAWGEDPERHEEQSELAVGWLRRAAELAAGRYEIEDALALLDQARELESQPSQKVEILRQSGDVHALRYDAQGCAPRWRRPSLWADRRGSRDLRSARLLRPRSSVHVEASTRARGRREVARERVALRARHPGTRLGSSRSGLSVPSKRMKAGKEAHRLGEALEDPKLVVVACERKAWSDRGGEVPGGVRVDRPCACRRTSVGGPGLAGLPLLERWLRLCPGGADRRRPALRGTLR